MRVYVSSPRLPLTGVHRSSPNCGAQSNVRANRALAADDLARDRFGEAFDASRLRRIGQHVEGRLLEDLRKARHVYAGFVRGKIGNHRKLAVIDARAAVDLQMDDAADARDAGAGERKSHLGLFGLTIGIEAQTALEPANAGVEREG